MTRKPSAVSPVASSVIATIKANIEARVEALGVSSGMIAKANGRNVSWISDLFIPGRYDARLSMVTIADVAAALGVTVPYLCSDDPKARAKMIAAPMPKYLEAAAAKPRRYTSKSRPDDIEPDEMTAKEVGAMLGCTRAGLCVWRGNGKGPKWRLTPTGRYLYSRASVEKFKATREA